MSYYEIIETILLKELDRLYEETQGGEAYWEANEAVMMALNILAEES